jgi:hypothetical protein
MGDLSLNFSHSEFACKCGCGLDNIDPRQAVIAELIRHHEGDKPMIPNSGCRCLNHNERIQMDVNENYIPFSSKSKHLPFTEDGDINGLTGETTATDYPSSNPRKLYDFLDNLFPDTYGIGLYSWGVHIDPRPIKARW